MSQGQLVSRSARHPRIVEFSREWFAFLEGVKGVRLRGGGVNFAGSSLIFPGRDGAPFTNQAFNARIKLACERARVPVISAHPLRTTCNGWRSEPPPPIGESCRTRREANNVLYRIVDPCVIDLIDRGVCLLEDIPTSQATSRP
jgi:hypothetical protein